MNATPVIASGLNFAHGKGELRRQVLFDINVEIQRGEIVILTGPSGSGKTTLLTLIGALRSMQEGRLRVLNHELAGANEVTLAAVRKRIGYIFQAHNLLEALTARQNVQVRLQLYPDLDRREIANRALATLDAVGLSDRSDAHPSELSGGERQRVAIARALTSKPELLLADEPTASLDRRTGRALVELLQRLAKKEGVTVILVTHDNRILDIADRILTLEDGRLSTLMRSVTTETQHMLHLLAEDLRKGHLSARLARMQRDEFQSFLEQVTHETHDLLEIANVVQGEAFGNVEEQVISALTWKLTDILHAEQAAIYFVNPDDATLRFCESDAKGVLEQKEVGSIGGIAGHVLRIGQMFHTADVGQVPQYDPVIDGEATQSVLAAPIRDSDDQVFAVIELRGISDKKEFSAEDQQHLAEFANSLGIIVESWWRMGCGCRRGAVGRSMGCAPPTLSCH